MNFINREEIGVRADLATTRDTPQAYVANSHFLAVIADDFGQRE